MSLNTSRRIPEPKIIHVSQNGAAMMEVERISPFLPSPSPNDLATLLGSLAPNALQCPNLEVIRVWSMPQKSLRHTFVNVYPYRYQCAGLSFDGSCLIMLDTLLNDGFTSKEIFQNSYKHMFVLPKGIKVFDTYTGALRAERSGYEGGYLTCDSSYPGLLLFCQIDSQTINKKKDCMFSGYMALKHHGLTWMSINSAYRR